MSSAVLIEPTFSKLLDEVKWCEANASSTDRDAYMDRLRGATELLISGLDKSSPVAQQRRELIPRLGALLYQSKRPATVEEVAQAAELKAHCEWLQLHVSTANLGDVTDRFRQARQLCTDLELGGSMSLAEIDLFDDIIGRAVDALSARLPEYYIPMEEVD
jgi:hypothetical protein